MHSTQTMRSPSCSSSNDFLTIDFNGKQEEKVCQVCGATPAGNHFDVVSCRPCSAFFRRTVVLNRSFACKLKGACPINKNIRSICSHCRFQKCVNLGMTRSNININYDKATPKDPAPSTSNWSLVPKASPIPLISKMLEGYNKFVDEAKRLFFVCNPEELFSKGKVFKPGTTVEYIVLNRAQLVYILEMAVNYFHPFRNIDEDDKKKIFRSFEFRFSKLHMFHLNTLYFPDDLNRLVTHYGRYVDQDNQEDFFRHDIDPKQSYRTLIETQTRLFRVSAKFKLMKVDEAEVVALAGLMMWKEVHYYFNDNRYSKIVDKILFELAWYEKQKVGESNYKTRFGSICCILRDIEELSIMLRESILMGKMINAYGVPKMSELETFKK